jgi:hypothetical protein
MESEPVLHSRRSLTLRFNIPIARTNQFWQALRQGRFTTTKCSKCGALSFPPQTDCPKCMGSEFSWVELGRDATLVTYTQVQVTPASFSDVQPYVIAIGELEQGLKVLAWLEGAQIENVKPGMKLRVEAREKDGALYYVFVPA